jgi:hypothetical protein
MSASSDSRPPRAPIVEERIRIALACAACLKRIARLAAEPHGIPLFADLSSFARVASQFAGAFDEHVRAIEAALPPSATNLDAPSAKKIAHLRCLIENLAHRQPSSVSRRGSR